MATILSLLAAGFANAATYIATRTVGDGANWIFRMRQHDDHENCISERVRLAIGDGGAGASGADL